MPSSNFKARFTSQYKDDINDPILTTLLDTIEAYQDEVQEQLLLSVYAQRSDQISDGLFEVLRRHLFGQMFPGPAFAVLHASIRNADKADPVLLEQSHYVSIQDDEGSKILFAPQYPSWIVPAQSNDVAVDIYGDDLLLGFNIYADRLSSEQDGSVRVYMGNVDPLVIERLRCRLPQAETLQTGETYFPSILRRSYPGILTFVDDFFHTAFDSRFLEIPFSVLKQASAARRGDGTVWIPFQGLREFAAVLEKHCTLNSYVAWNMVEEESLAIPLDTFRFTLPIMDHRYQNTIITSIRDLGSDGSIEYFDATMIADPAYPFQFTRSIDTHNDRIVLALHPAPAGDIRVQYAQYDLSDNAINIAQGRNYVLYQGIDLPLKSVQSITPTMRVNALSDKQQVWDYFRSLLASRNRWLTRDDLRAAVKTFPPFSANKNMVRSERIRFEEKVGRVKGFLTPFTEILVPVRDRAVLSPPDLPYFERKLGTYIKSRTVHGNFFRVKLVAAEDV